MTSREAALTVGVWTPLAVIWIVVMVDLVRRSPLSRKARVWWGLACTLFWPALIAYLLMRPTRGRLSLDEARSDRRALLVDAVLDRESGRITEEEWASTAEELRRR